MRYFSCRAEASGTPEPVPGRGNLAQTPACQCGGRFSVAGHFGGLPSALLQGLGVARTPLSGTLFLLEAVVLLVPGAI